MKIVWERGEATVRDVYEELLKKRKIAYTTVIAQARDGNSRRFQPHLFNEPSPEPDGVALPAANPQIEFPSDGGKQIKVGAAVMARKLRRSVPPVYPPLAKEARIQGIVRFNVQIAKGGSVKAMQLISGHPLLTRAAMEALRQYEYEPHLLDGELVQVVTEVDVPFNLN